MAFCNSPLFVTILGHEVRIASCELLGDDELVLILECRYCPLKFKMRLNIEDILFSGGLKEEIE